MADFPPMLYCMCMLLFLLHRFYNQILEEMHGLYGLGMETEGW